MILQSRNRLYIIVATSVLATISILGYAFVGLNSKVDHQFTKVTLYSNPDRFWQSVQAQGELSSLIAGLVKLSADDETSFREIAKRSRFLKLRMKGLTREVGSSFEDSSRHLLSNKETFDAVADLCDRIDAALEAKNIAALTRLKRELLPFVSLLSRISSENFTINSSRANESLGKLVAAVSDSEANNTLLSTVLLCAVLIMIALVAWLALVRERLTGLIDKLRQSQSSEAAAIQMRDERMRFLRTMSHELRTPLNGIVGVLDLIRTAKASRIPQLIETATTSAEALIDLVGDVLELSKLEQHPPAESFEILKLIENVAKALEPIATRKNLNLSVRASSFIPHALLGSPSNMRQILVNIVGNALKYTDAGSVIINVRCTEITACGMAKLQIKVSDTGIGMSAEVRERMFQEFYSGGGDRSQSNGLGLAIVYRLLEMMGGTIQCESVEGRGTMFVIELTMPIAELPAEQTQPCADEHELPASDERSPPMDILVVDDNQTNAMIALEMLQDTPHVASWASNGLEAVEFAIAGTYDLIFMDISMPGIDGVEACRRIRAALPPERMPKIYALTAHAIQGDREHFLASGFDGYLSKPLRRRDILQTLVLLRECEAPAKVENGLLPRNDDQPRCGETAAANKSDGCSPELDPSAFQEFVLDRPAQFVDRLLTVCIRELGTHREALGSAMVDDDIAGMKHHFHTVKSMAGSVGAKRLQALTLRAERDCSTMTPAERQALAGEISDSIGNCIEELDVKLMARVSAERTEVMSS